MADAVSHRRVLERIYSFHEETAGRWRFACRRGCHPCCTQSLAITGLEGKYLLGYLHDHGRTADAEADPAAPSGPRFLQTTNQYAAACLSAQAALPEEPGWNLDPCPFLGETGCSVYPARPFACRAMLSLRPCRRAGAAEAPPLLITFNTIIMQVLEHLDQGGVWGNMLQVLSFLRAPSRQARQEQAARLLTSSPCPGFLVPPEEREAVDRMLEALISARVDDTTVGGLLGAGG